MSGLDSSSQTQPDSNIYGPALPRTPFLCSHSSCLLAPTSQPSSPCPALPLQGNNCAAQPILPSQEQPFQTYSGPTQLPYNHPGQWSHANQEPRLPIHHFCKRQRSSDKHRQLYTLSCKQILQSPDVVATVETFLNEAIPNNYCLIQGYTRWYRRDRLRGTFGGVAVCFCKNVSV